MRPIACARTVAVVCLAALAACTTGQSGGTPPVNFTSGNGTLNVAVGTVNFAGFGAGVNVLETFRGSNGFTAVPINSAVLTGPAGFAGAPGSTDPGSGQAAIPLGSAHNQFVIGTGGTILDSADGFGVGPPGSSNAGQNFYPMQPQFGDALAAQLAGFGIPNAANIFPVQFIYGGPPAYPPYSYVPSALSSTLAIPSGWSEGFYVVAAAPVPGSYTLNVSYTQNGTTSTKSKQTTLAGTLLPPWNPATGITLASTGTGGATVTASLPPGVKEALVNVLDVNVVAAIFPGGSLPPGATPCQTGLPFATVEFKRSSAQAIPANLGRGGAPTYCKGDILVAQAYGFDYDDAELGPPVNTSPDPALPAQADVTINIPVTTQE